MSREVIADGTGWSGLRSCSFGDVADWLTEMMAPGGLWYVSPVVDWCVHHWVYALEDGQRTLTLWFAGDEVDDEWLACMGDTLNSQFGDEWVHYVAEKQVVERYRHVLETKLPLLEFSFVDKSPIGLSAPKLTIDDLAGTETLTWPSTPEHLVHAKGPRNKWGAAKGARAR